MIVLDSGNLFSPSKSVHEDELLQRKMKADLILKSFSKIGIDALTPGENDFVFGLDFIKEKAALYKLPYVSANLYDAKTSEQIFPSYKILNINNKKVGIFGIFSTLDKESFSYLKIEDPILVAKKIESELRAQNVDIVIVLSSQPTTRTKDLAKALPSIDFIFSNSFGRDLEKPEQVDNVMLFEAGKQGKHIGYASFSLSNDNKKAWLNGLKKTDVDIDSLQKQIKHLNEKIDEERVAEDTKKVFALEQKRNALKEVYDYEKQIASKTKGRNKNSSKGFHYKLISVESDIKDDKTISSMVDSTLKDISTAMISSAKSAHSDSNQENNIQDTLSQGHKTIGNEKTEHPYFVGADSCKTCHAVEHKQWLTTMHSKAYSTLVKSKRNMDLQCVACHVTGFKEKGGPQSLIELPRFQNVQCESCHSAGSLHIVDPKKHKLPSRVDESKCLTCHTKEQTGGQFIYKDYIKKVLHKS